MTTLPYAIVGRVADALTEQGGSANWEHAIELARAALEAARYGELEQLVRTFDRLSRSIMIDVGSAHKARGAAASDFMREDDADFRSDLREAFDKARALLSTIGEPTDIGASHE